MSAVVGKTNDRNSMEAGGVVTGTLQINGFTSPVITTVNNNIRETRSVVLRLLIG